MSWTAIIVLSVGAYALKAFGLLVLGGRPPSPRFAALAGLLPAALMTALIVVMTVERDESLVVDARLAGVLAGAVVTWLKAPFVVVVIVAMAVAAAVRLL